MKILAVARVSVVLTDIPVIVLVLDIAIAALLAFCQSRSTLTIAQELVIPLYWVLLASILVRRIVSMCRITGSVDLHRFWMSLLGMHGFVENAC